MNTDAPRLRPFHARVPAEKPFDSMRTDRWPAYDHVRLAANPDGSPPRSEGCVSGHQSVGRSGGGAEVMKSSRTRKA
jgi:hypothetical protein